MIPAPKRRWFAYSLWTLFVVVTVFGCWLGWNVHQVHQRDRLLESRDFLRALEEPTGYVDTPGNGAFAARMKALGFKTLEPRKKSPHAIPALWSLLGAEPLEMDIRLDADKFSESDLFRVKASTRFFRSALSSRSCWPSQQFWSRSTAAPKRPLGVGAAAAEVVDHKLKAAGGEGGVIALDARGNFAAPHNSEAMYRGYVTRDGKTHVTLYDE